MIFVFIHLMWAVRRDAPPLRTSTESPRRGTFTATRKFLGYIDSYDYTFFVFYRIVRNTHVVLGRAYPTVCRKEGNTTVEAYVSYDSRDGMVWHLCIQLDHTSFGFV